MHEILSTVSGWLDQLFAYGTFWVYIIIFLACFIENIVPPFPGDTFIVAAGGLSALGRLEYAGSFISVVCGGMASVMLVHYWGRRYGRDYFLKKNFKYFSVADIERVESLLQKWGGMLLLGSRFVVGFRSALALGTGIGRYSSVRTFFYSSISYLIFTSLLMYMAAVFVDNADKIGELFGTYDKIIYPLIIIGVLWFVAWRFVSRRAKKSQRKGM